MNLMQSVVPLIYAPILIHAFLALALVCYSGEVPVKNRLLSQFTSCPAGLKPDMLPDDELATLEGVESVAFAFIIASVALVTARACDLSWQLRSCDTGSP